MRKMNGATSQPLPGLLLTFFFLVSVIGINRAQAGARTAGRITVTMMVFLPSDQHNKAIMHFSDNRSMLFGTPNNGPANSTNIHRLLNNIPAGDFATLCLGDVTCQRSQLSGRFTDAYEGYTEAREILALSARMFQLEMSASSNQHLVYSYEPKTITLEVPQGSGLFIGSGKTSEPAESMERPLCMPSNQGSTDCTLTIPSPTQAMINETNKDADYYRQMTLYAEADAVIALSERQYELDHPPQQ